MKAITVAILAMGGEGGGVLADWIVDAAEHNGYLAQMTSVPGVAQRTGSTIYYVELFPEAAAQAAGQDPVLALMPVPGQVDVVIASELMEAGRAVQRGLVTSERTTLIASTHRVYSMTERTAVGDGRVDSGALLDAARDAARRLIHADFAKVAADNGSVISAALCGALAATSALPVTREQFVDAIRRGGVGVESSLAAFAAGFDAAGPATDEAPAQSEVAGDCALGDRVRREFPAPCHEILLAGVARLADYQDEAYAVEYLSRLAAIREADGVRGTLLRETARYLALWMSYEDACRVADLKTRPSRFERIAAESRLAPGQLLRVHDYLYPRIGELSDVLPAGLGQWLMNSRWAGRVVGWFTRHGRTVQSTSISGFAQLRMMASLGRWRRRSLRYRREHAKIGEWLRMLPGLAAEDYALACEVAECPRLIKGYGDTHVRGSANYDTLMRALPGLRHAPDAASRLRRLRDAALADETGAALAAALQTIDAAAVG